MTETLEKLSENIFVSASKDRFGTDAFLLASFAAPRKKDIVCDLGTGCGIIPLLMSRENAPKIIYALDIQEGAIQQLKKRIAASTLENEIIPINADLKDLWADALGTLDVVTCNPPYKASDCGIESELTAENRTSRDFMQH